MQRYDKDISTEVNGDLHILMSSGSRSFIEIWQDDDLVEFEYEKIPELIAALQGAYDFKLGELK